jgi:cell wall-associated NlpC family hydrolase
MLPRGLRFFAFLAFLLSVCAEESSAAGYAVAERPVPVFSRADFWVIFGGQDGKTVQTDRCGQIRSLEFVALPGTAFTINAELKQAEHTVYRVTTADYPYQGKSYFIDSRSVKTVAEKPRERQPRMPEKGELLARLRAAEGARYVWGGNIRSGIAEQLLLYPPAGAVSSAAARIWRLQGVDCSGLLYEATDGATPRNTSELVNFGSPVPVAGLGPGALASLLRPLDLIVWSGHVMIVLDNEEIMESRLDCARPEHGVIIRPLLQGVQMVMKSRRPVDVLGSTRDKEFVVRRWFK